MEDLAEDLRDYCVCFHTVAKQRGWTSTTMTMSECAHSERLVKEEDAKDRIIAGHVMKSQVSSQQGPAGGESSVEVERPLNRRDATRYARIDRGLPTTCRR
jgi:hypothetical protein